MLYECTIYMRVCCDAYKYEALQSVGGIVYVLCDVDATNVFNYLFYRLIYTDNYYIHIQYNGE